MQEYDFPFYHIIIDNFLDDKNYKYAQATYEQQRFDLKYTDLFKFMQTPELAMDEDLQFFIKELGTVFNKITDTKNTYYTIFASYYRKGDYLLCHDDRVEHRKYAFTYYLDDCNSGDLVLFNKDCDKEVKRVSVKKNRLVIFEVSEISYHEVDLCITGRRKAITGWINSKEHNLDMALQPVNYVMPKNLQPIRLDLDFSDSKVLKYPGIEYSWSFRDKKEDGPFYMRRIDRLILEDYVILDIKKYICIFVEAYHIDSLSYILLNDKTNQYKGDIIDVFIIEQKNKDNKSSELIKYLDEEGKHVFSLYSEEKVMFAVKRESLKYYIEKGNKIPCYIIHMIYEKDESFY